MNSTSIVSAQQPSFFANNPRTSATAGVLTGAGATTAGVLMAVGVISLGVPVAGWVVGGLLIGAGVGIMAYTAFKGLTARKVAQVAPLPAERVDHKSTTTTASSPSSSSSSSVASHSTAASPAVASRVTTREERNQCIDEEIAKHINNPQELFRNNDTKNDTKNDAITPYIRTEIHPGIRSQIDRANIDYSQPIAKEERELIASDGSKSLKHVLTQATEGRLLRQSSAIVGGVVSNNSDDATNQLLDLLADVIIKGNHAIDNLPKSSEEKIKLKKKLREAVFVNILGHKVMNNQLVGRATSTAERLYAAALTDILTKQLNVTGSPIHTMVNEAVNERIRQKQGA